MAVAMDTRSVMRSGQAQDGTEGGWQESATNMFESRCKDHLTAGTLKVSGEPRWNFCLISSGAPAHRR